MLLHLHGYLKTQTNTDVLRETIPAHGATANVLNYSAASVVCAVCKDWDKVLGVFEEMGQKKIPPNAACLTDLVVVSVKTGQWEELLEVIRRSFVVIVDGSIS